MIEILHVDNYASLYFRFVLFLSADVGREKEIDFLNIFEVLLLNFQELRFFVIIDLKQFISKEFEYIYSLITG